MLYRSGFHFPQPRVALVSRVDADSQRPGSAVGFCGAKNPQAMGASSKLVLLWPLICVLPVLKMSYMRWCLNKAGFKLLDHGPQVQRMLH